ncbi:hypothetical protein PHYC_03048 [Phycisphaerales bacterium]|nr:hypothetical protein PHYC_03048 [Phycisphaerales bacterium]
MMKTGCDIGYIRPNMPTRILIPIAVLSLAGTAFANHGPGTSGGSSSVVSGETLKPGTWEFALRFDATEFEHVTHAEVEERALAAGEFDALRRAFLTTLSVSYGVTEDFQAGVELGYYYGQDFVSAHVHGGEAEADEVDIEGLADLWLNAKYRFVKGKPGNLAVFGGIKLPVGEDEVMLDDHRVEASSQPGSGALDLRLGLAYSRFLSSRVTLDASVAYTHRTPSGDFKVGDRFDAGVGVAYRLIEDVNKFPNISIFGEATLVWLGEDAHEGEENENSGGTTVYLGVGARVRICRTVALTVSPCIPVMQDLNGDQIETRFKVAVGLSFTF